MMTMQMVSLPFLPFSRTVSPRKSSSCSIFAAHISITELSSLADSSTTKRLGARFLTVAGSSFAFLSLCCCVKVSVYTREGERAGLL